MAITPFVSDIEMNQNIIYRACFHAENFEPQNPKDGQYYLNKEDNRVYFYRTSDNKWHKIGDGIVYSAGNMIEISPTYVISVKQELIDRVETLEQEMSDASTDIDEIADTITTMQQDIITNTTNIKNLKTEVGAIQTEIIVINDNLIDIQDQINTINNQLSFDEDKIDKNASDILALQNRVSTAETNIDNNKNEIDALKPRVKKNEDDIAKLKSDVSDLNTDLNDLDNKKLDKDFTDSVLTDIEIIRKTVTDVSVKETHINPSTGVVIMNDNIIPLVDEVNSGLATAEMFNTVEDNKTRIEILEQQGGHYIGQSFATFADLSKFTIPNNLNVGDFTYVLDDENHEDATTRYILTLNQTTNTKEFRFAYVINYDPVGKFTQTELGLIIGKNQDGYVFAEADGSGSVVGWDSLVSRTTDLETNLTELTNNYNDFLSNDFKDVSDRLVLAEKDIDNLEKDVDDLEDRKADKDKLQSVLTSLKLQTTNDANGKANILDLMKTTYNTLDDSSATTNIRLPLASSTTAGLASIEDKIKIDGIEGGAEVNQNAYSYMKVIHEDASGSPTNTIIGAKNKTDTFTFEPGDGIKFTPDTTKKSLKIESTVKIPPVATWTTNGLQAKYDKEREDKMGMEIWEANIDANGDYTIDIEDFAGYIGNDSHIYVKFMQKNITKEPKLTIKSTTASYTLIDKAPIMQTTLTTPKKKSLKDGSLLELVYKADGKFYIIAGTGSGGGRSWRIWIFKD